MVKMNSKKKSTLIKFGRELIRVLINLLIDGIEFMLFKGLIILKFLRDFKLTDDFTEIKYEKLSIILNH